MLLHTHTHTHTHLSTPPIPPSPLSSPLSFSLPMCLARWHIESSEREFLSVGKERGRKRGWRGRERGKVSLEELAEKRTLEEDTYCGGSPQGLLHCSTGGENSNVTIHKPHTTIALHANCIQCLPQTYHTRTSIIRKMSDLVSCRRGM